MHFSSKVLIVLQATHAGMYRRFAAKRYRKYSRLLNAFMGRACYTCKDHERIVTYHICRNKRPGRLIFRSNTKNIPKPVKADRFCVLPPPPPLKNLFSVDAFFGWVFISGWAFISANTVSPLDLHNHVRKSVFFFGLKRRRDLYSSVAETVTSVVEYCIDQTQDYNSKKWRLVHCWVLEWSLNKNFLLFSKMVSC